METPIRSFRMTDAQLVVIKKILITIKSKPEYLDSLNIFHNEWLIKDKRRLFEKLREELNEPHTPKKFNILQKDKHRPTPIQETVKETGCITPPPQNLLAKELLEKRVPMADGSSRVLTRAEIEREILIQLGVSRNSAQKAATNAVKKYDPDNSARWGRKRPKARVVPAEVKLGMIKQRLQGMTVQDIAKETGFDARTVRKYTGKKNE